MNTSENGSCHCGAVRFDLELDRGTPGIRCNCSYCLKVRSWAVILPAASLRLRQGEDSLGHYAFGPGREVHHFCRQCGVRLFGRGEPAGKPAYVTVNLACLDSLDEAALAALPIRYVDGKHERWDAPPDQTRHL